MKSINWKYNYNKKCIASNSLQQEHNNFPILKDNIKKKLKKYWEKKMKSKNHKKTTAAVHQDNKII